MYLLILKCLCYAGKLTMIIGQVGSGKSSLLSAILGEMTTVSGDVQINRFVFTSCLEQTHTKTNYKEEFKGTAFIFFFFSILNYNF